MAQVTIESEPEFAKSECIECGKSFRRRVFRSCGKEYFKIRSCGQCSERKAEQDRIAEEEERRARRLVEWNKAIPSSYRQNDRSRLNPNALDVADQFDFQEDKGIYIHGDFRKGKTRCACGILKKAHDRGQTVMMISATEFARYCSAQFSDNTDIKRNARGKLDQCKSIGVLLIDDLGKEKITDRIETELFDIIEYRTSRSKPILITSNFGLNELAQRMSADQGPAIVGRIMEFCHIVTLK